MDAAAALSLLRRFNAGFSPAIVIGITGGLTSFVAVQLGALKVSPLESRGYEAFAELFILLGMLGLKAVFFVVLPAILLSMLLRRFEGLGPRLVVYGVFALISAPSATSSHCSARRPDCTRRNSKRNTRQPSGWRPPESMRKIVKSRNKQTIRRSLLP